MEKWESIIAKKMRPCAKMAEDVAHQRKLEYERKREATPERKEQHRIWAHSEAGKESMRRRNKKWRESEHGREVCRAKSRRWYAAHKKDPEFMARKNEYDRNYRAMQRANKKMPSAVTIALQDIGLMTVHLVRSAAA